MRLNFCIKYNEENGCYDFKERGGFHLTYQESQCVMEALNAVITKEMEEDYAECLNQIEKERFTLEVEIYLNLTEKGWRASEINAGDIKGYRALTFEQYVIVKKLLQQRFNEVDDKGVSIIKKNVEIHYERKSMLRKPPHLMMRTVNKEKKNWSFTCCTCGRKVNSTEISHWWITVLLSEKGRKKYCSEVCAEKGLQERIADVKEEYYLDHLK